MNKKNEKSGKNDPDKSSIILPKMNDLETFTLEKKASVIGISAKGSTPKKHLVPPPKDDKGESKLNLTLSATIDEIIKINEFEGFFRFKTTLSRVWYNTQLTFLNLKNDSTKNVLSSEEKDLMWIPWTVFDNIESIKDYLRTDANDILTIEANDNFTYRLDDKTNMKRTRLFTGSENIIRFTRQFSIKFICNFDLKFYPFDEQTCYLEMYQAENSADLKFGTVQYLGPMELQNHHVYFAFLCKSVSNGRNVLRLGIKMGRPMFSTFLNLFLPSPARAKLKLY